MRRTLLILLGALLAGGLLSVAVQYDTGYVRITYGRYLIETNVMVGVALFLLLLLLGHWLLRLLQQTRQGSTAVRRWVGFSAQRRARKRTTQGLLALAEGKWPRAERLLSHAAQHADTPLINYLAAAQAAYEQGADERIEQWLRKAFESTPGSDLAVGITQAQLQLGRQQLEPCLATLLRLRKQAPRHPFVLKLLASVYPRLDDWHAMRQLLPDLRKLEVLPAAELDTLERRLWQALLDQAAGQIQRATGASQNLEPLDALWDEVPAALRKHEDIIHTYASHLTELGAPGQAETLLRKVLRHDWSNSLVLLYGRIPGMDVEDQLRQAERWLTEQSNNPALLLTLGRLSLRNQMWGKAREYLEASLKLQRNRETLAELCRLTAHQGDHEATSRYLMQGLLDSTSLPDLPMPQGVRGR